MRGFSLLLMMFLLWPSLILAAEEPWLIDDFDQGIGSHWQRKSFKDDTHYTSIPDERGGQVLQAQSKAAASGLFVERKFHLEDWPVLAWRWKIADTLPNGDATRKEGDDYAARLYVVFPHWLFWKTRTINYIWANKLPQGEVIDNPFTANAQMLAVESGNAKAGQWVEERRNVLADYRHIWGEEPPEVGAIAIMTDTDNTGGEALAWYDDLRLEKE